MTATLWQRLDQVGRNVAPVAATGALVLVGLVPSPLPLFDRIAPMLTVMAVYYWAIHRPDLMPPSAAFAIGLMQDLLGGEPPGLNALTLVVVHWTVMSQRSFFLAKSFFLLWWGFGLVALGAVVLQWVVQCLLQLSFLPVVGQIFRSLVTITLFPPLAWCLIKVHRAFLTPP